MQFFSKKKKVLLLSTFFIPLTIIFIFLYFVGFNYKISTYKNDPTSKKGLYAYDLGGLRLLFSAESKIDKEIKGMTILHKNNFWEVERCAGMIPSIFKKTIFFVDRKISINANGDIEKESLIYNYNFIDSTLIEIKSPLPVDRIYKKGDVDYASTIFMKKFIFMFMIDKEHQTLKLRNFYILPRGYNYIIKSNFLQWCNFDSHECIMKQEYVGFEDQRKIDTLRHDEEKYEFSYNAHDLIVKNKYKNIFLGY